MVPIWMFRVTFIIAVLCLLYALYLIWKSLPKDEGDRFDDPGVGE